MIERDKRQQSGGHHRKPQADPREHDADERHADLAFGRRETCCEERAQRQKKCRQRQQGVSDISERIDQDPRAQRYHQKNGPLSAERGKTTSYNTHTRSLAASLLRI